MVFHWRMAPRVPAETTPPSSFTSQSDAESWVGENWRALAAAGVDTVTLLDGQQVLYEMPLTED